jgi:hypothetical protein
METCYVGRFCIGVPIGMKPKGRSHRLRLTHIGEFSWQNDKDHDVLRNEMWNAKVAEIKRFRPIENESSPIIEQRRFEGLGLWARGIFYHENWALENEAVWEILVDYGASAIWFKANSALIDKENVQKVINNLNNLAKAYRPRVPAASFGVGDWFYLQDGAINLPYRWEEQSYASFEGDPLDLQLEIEMNDTQVDEPKEEGLFARTAAAIATGYALGVDIKKVRSRNRMAAGIKGEEQVVRMKDKDGAKLDFTWRYAGKKNSGEFPEIVISMESPDGQIDEKLKVWDAVLDSMKPLYKTSP